MNKEEKIKVLQDIVKIKSVNGNELEVAEYIKKLLNEHGIKSELIEYSEGRSSLVAEIGEDNGKVLGFTGHMDVVDVGDEADWKYPPFEAHINDGKLYGRGSTDMKSGLTAMIISMIELKDEDVKLNGKIRLLATVGEEIGELGSEQLTEKGYADDLSALIIGEPAGTSIVYTHKGSINYRVKSTGKEAHSSAPAQGINAINYISEFINIVNKEMNKIAEKYNNEELGRTIHNVTVIRGGNQVNTIPSEAELQGNIRTIPEFDNDKAINLIAEIIKNLNEEKDCKLELTIDFNKIPVETYKDSEIINIIQDTWLENNKEKLSVIGISGTTDAAEFTKSKNKFDFAVFGPGEPMLAHKVDEYVEIDNYLDIIEAYKKIAKRYLS
ncbi:ArgE/DapE family deacylase [Miniphocaeibacter massiliensis]|uniref:ArgE/DapE family deacylase n=1 Tax=Miniphocaeibacter massiliensis TaxID=2041841 RepID=UPI000C0702B5|nr:ArgE/DapE family deacylase [Miniphocaeibacter massiliensis]